MKRLHVFIIKSYLGPLIMTFFISMFVLLMQFLWRYIDDLVGKGLDSSVIVELLTYASFGLVPMALPLAILLAALMTFGNLGENYELTAMKSSGISLQRIMFPLMTFIVVISIAAFFFSNNVLPYTSLKTYSLLYDIKHQRPELDIEEGIFNNDLADYTIRVSKKNPETNMMYDFMLYDHTDRKGNTNVTVSDSAYMYVTKDEKYLVLELYNGIGYEELKERQRYGGSGRNFPMQRNKFDKQRMIFGMDIFELSRTDDGLFKNHFQMMDLEQLAKSEDSLQKKLNEKRNSFSRNLANNNIFRVEPKVIYNDSIKDVKPDSLKYNVVPDVVYDVDSVFNSLAAKKKQDIISSALSQASSTKSYITSKSKDVTSRIRRIRRHQIEWHRKFTLSFACFIFFFIGAPLGAIIRKGGLGMPTVISVVFFIIYYVISLTGEKFVREDMIIASQGMWISSMVLLPLGAFLTYKATSDSVILNIDTYLKFVDKIRDFILQDKNK